MVTVGGQPGHSALDAALGLFRAPPPLAGRVGVVATGGSGLWLRYRTSTSVAVRDLGPRPSGLNALPFRSARGHGSGESRKLVPAFRHA